MAEIKDRRWFSLTNEFGDVMRDGHGRALEFDVLDDAIEKADSHPMVRLICVTTVLRVIGDPVENDEGHGHRGSER